MHWIFVWNRIKIMIRVIPNIYWFVFEYIIHIIFEKLDKHWQICSCFYRFYPFLCTGTTSTHFTSSGDKTFVEVLIDIYGKGACETFLESNRLIARDIWFLSTFLKMKVEFNSVHLFLIASLLGWSLDLKINFVRSSVLS